VTGSMTEAARRLHTSQPQISRLISQLEEITGFALFQRNGSRLARTLDGDRFFRDVEQTFAGLAALETAAARIRAFSASRLSVAAGPRLAGGLLARSVARFKREHPEVMVSIHAGDVASVHSWVSSGLCDVGLAMLYADTSGVRVQPIATIECVAILPPSHPLTAREQLGPADFDGERFVSPPSGNPLRSRLDEIFAAAGTAPITVAEASLGASVCALVGAGIGVSLINSLAAAEEKAGVGLETRPFRPRIPLDVVLMYPEGQTQNRLVGAFSACAEAMIREEITAHTGLI
jgi:DNA-binding transcriptional LysR family regulator